LCDNVRSEETAAFFPRKKVSNVDFVVLALEIKLVFA